MTKQTGPSRPRKLALTDRVRPRATPDRRYSTDLAAALAIGWQRGGDFTDHFPAPYNLHEIADVISFFVEPMLRRDYGPKVAAAMHWIGVVRLCNFGQVTRLMTDRQMQDGVWDEEVGVPCDLGSGCSTRTNRRSRDVLRDLGLLRFTLAPRGLVVTLMIQSVLRIASDTVIAAMHRRHGRKGFKVRMERLVVGKDLADQVGKDLADQVGKDLADKETNDRYQEKETKDVTDLPTASVPPPVPLDGEVSAAVILPASSNGAQPAADDPAPAITLPPRAARWLRAEGLATGGDGTVQLSTFSRRRLAEASEGEIRRAHRYASEWRKRARAHRTDSAEEQFVALATTGSLPLQRLQVLAFHQADPKAVPRFRDPPAEVTRRLHGLHPLWIEGRINKTARQPDVENRWAYLLAALDNRADHDRWLKDRRSPAIVAAEAEEAR